MITPNLSELALKHGTDKNSTHYYTCHYEQHLERFRHEPVRLLEIGVGGYEDPSLGGQWKEYFQAGISLAWISTTSRSFWRKG